MLMLTMPQIKAFAAVARNQHFTRAAEELQVSQPSVSYQVRQLEAQLKIRLVEVAGRRVYLTDAGERFATRAQGLLNEIEDLEREMRDYREGVIGRLRVGATRTVGGYALPPVIAEFRRRHPEVKFRLVVDNTEAIENLLLKREVDLAVVEWEVESRKLVSRALCRDALVLIAPPDHPLAARDRIELDDLKGEPFVMREPGSGTRALAERALGDLAGTVTTVLELDQPEAIVRAVEAGLGLAFISEVIADRHIASGQLRALPVEGLELSRDFSLVTMRARPDSPAMRAFSELLIRSWQSKPSASKGRHARVTPKAVDRE